MCTSMHALAFVNVYIYAYGFMHPYKNILKQNACFAYMISYTYCSLPHHPSVESLENPRKSNFADLFRLPAKKNIAEEYYGHLV